MAENSEKQLTVKLLPTQYKVIKDNSHREILYSGSFGVGKSYILAYKILQHALIPNNLVLLTRKTRAALVNTTLRALIYGDGNTPPVLIPGSYEHIPSRSIINIYNGGSVIYRGSDDDMSIRSLNLGFIGVDEAIELTYDEYMTLLSRLRNNADPHRQILSVTNPSSPNHFLYKRFFEEKDDTRIVYSAQATENHHLPKDYIESLQKLNGVEYDRYYLGKWTANSGAVYKDFSQDLIQNISKEETDEVIIGLDIGYSDPTAIITCFYNRKQKIFKIADEIYTPNLLPSDIVNNIIKIKEKYGDITVIYDPSAKGIGDEIASKGIKTEKADNSIMEGISRVQETMRDKRFVIDAKCENTLKELDLYSWHDDKMDKPIDKYNHACFVRNTVIGLDNQDKYISDINGETDTFMYNKVSDGIKTGEAECHLYIINNKPLMCTDDHPIYVDDNKESIGDLWKKYNTKNTCQEDKWLRKLFFKGEYIGDIQSQKKDQTKYIINAKANTFQNTDIYTETTGLQKMVLYQKDITYTILMKIVVIIISIILDLLLLKNILANTRKNIIEIIKKNVCKILTKLETLQKFGMLATKVKNGIKTMLKTFYLKKCEKKTQQLNVSAVEKNLKYVHSLKNIEKDLSAQINVNHNKEDLIKKITLRLYALYAGMYLKKTNMLKQYIVQDNVVVSQEEIKHIKRIPVGKLPVYNISVDKLHYYFANGIKVSNCDSIRYLIASQKSEKYIYPTIYFEEDKESVNDEKEKKEIKENNLQSEEPYNQALNAFLNDEDDVE